MGQDDFKLWEVYQLDSILLIAVFVRSRQLIISDIKIESYENQYKKAVAYYF